MDVTILINNARRKKAQVIDLSNKNINTLPIEFYDLSLLLTIDLSNNYIKEISKKIQNFSFLKSLNLNSNPIEVLPVEMCNMTSLETIYLKNTPLEKSFNWEGALWRNELKSFLDIDRKEESKVIIITNKNNKIKNTSDPINNNSDLFSKPSFNVIKEVKVDKEVIQENNENDELYDNFDINTTEKNLSNNSLPIEQLQLSKENELEDIIRKLSLENNILKEKLEKTNISNTLNQTFQSNTNNNSRVKTARKNWMDDKPEDTSNVIITNNNQNSKVSKEEENLLLKEQQTNKRLKLEIDRLNDELQNINKHSNSISNNVDIIDLNTINIGDKIGEGGFAVIHKGQWLYTDIAVKIIFNPKITEDLLDEFNNEIQMLSHMNHPNIISIIGICTKPKLAIVSEYASKGSLFDLLYKNKSLEISLNQKLFIIIEVCKALCYLSNKNIVHRDIKSHNILIKSDFSIKLCDFGLAKHVKNLNKGTNQFSGTPSYMAPELFNKKPYNEKVDIFAFGTLMWEILARKVPYEGFDALQIKTIVSEGKDMPIPITQEKIPDELFKLINKCRLLKYENRPDFQTVIQSLIEIRNKYGLNY
jgi:tRNA A-37 threonylcarbamoyl transferase component Bud32